METTLLSPCLFVTLKYSNFATDYFRNMIVLVYYFLCKSLFYGADVAISYLIFAHLALYCTVHPGILSNLLHMAPCHT